MRTIDNAVVPWSSTSKVGDMGEPLAARLIEARFGGPVVYAPGSYFPDWDLKVGDVTFEVKTQPTAKKWGNVFVEGWSHPLGLHEYMRECNERDHWSESGLLTTKADYWVEVVDKNEVYLMPTQVMKDFFRKVARNGGTVTGGNQRCSRGAKVPLEWLEDYLMVMEDYPPSAWDTDRY